MKLKIAIPAVLIAGAIAWYAFRPERLIVNKAVSEALPTVAQAASSEKTLASGSFHTVAHDTSGTATIHELADGSRVLRFTNFKTSNGPDVHVYLVAAADASDSETVKKAGFIDLGEIKGNIGDQNYTLGPQVDLAKYRAVSVWCKRFSANFGTAPLMGDQASGSQKTLASGSFHTVAHDTSGNASIYQLADGSRVLRFTNFKTSNGPDVHVYLVASDDAKDSETVKQAGFIDLGEIKGNIGDQNYTLGSDVDLSKYRAVSVWCKRFSANFGTAPLSMGQMMSQK
jgi:Electron transfer DM13